MRDRLGAAPRLLVVSGAAVVTIAAALAQTAIASTPARQAVPQGLNAALIRGAVRTGTTAPSTKLTVAFILKARNWEQLASRAQHAWSGPFLSVAQFAAQYGQPPSVIQALQKYLGGYGIATTPYTDGLDVKAVGTAAEFNQALSIGLSNYRIPGRSGSSSQVIYASRTNPQMPVSLASQILSILGLTNYGPFASTAVHAPGVRSTATNDQIPPGMRTPADFTKRYNLDPLLGGGKLGAGQTLAIVTLASLNPAVPQRFWTKYLGLSVPAGRIALKDVDGGAGPVSLNAGSDESTLDVEQSGAIAPQAKIVVYQAPNTDAGFVDGFFSAAADNRAGSVSASWGSSETMIQLQVNQGTESPTYAAAFDEAFAELAAQGQSAFLSSGDFGAYTPIEDAGTTNLGPGNPSDSPFVTSAGGTTLPGTQVHDVLNAKGGLKGTVSVDIPQERAWSWDYLWPIEQARHGGTLKASAFAYPLGGGGGYSVLEPRPSYQDGVSGVSSIRYRQYLRPTAYTNISGITLPTNWAFDASPALGSGPSPEGRVQPDISFNGDPETGYALYMPQFTKVYGGPVQQYGGTSFVAPQLNGSAAVMESFAGHRLGFWNPTMYAAAQGAGSPFTPLNSTKVYGSSFYSVTGNVKPVTGEFSNNNLYYTGNPGTVYNAASGLGFANLSQLAHVLAAAG